MATREEHTIDIEIKTHDDTTSGLKSAEAKMRSFEQTVNKTQAKLRDMTSREYRVVLDAIDRVTPAGSRAQAMLRGFAGHTYDAVIGAIDRTGSAITAARAKLSAFTSKSYEVAIYAKAEIGGAMGGLKNSLSSAASSAMMLGMGGFGLTAMAEKAVNAGNNLYMLSNKLHITTAEAGQMSKITSMAGVDVDTFAKSMMRLDGQAMHAGKEANNAQMMLNKYGISLTDAGGKLLPYNQQLEALAIGYKKASENGEEEEFVMNTLGARGMALVPILENLQDFKGIAGNVKGIGLDAEEAHKTWMEMQALKLQAGQVGLVMANAFMPVVKELLPMLTEQFQKVASFFKNHSDIVQAAAKVTAYGMELMAVVTVGKLLIGVLKSIGTLAAVPFKILTKLGSPLSGGTGGSAGAAAGSIGKEMIINAQTVIVNGKSAGGSLPGGASGAAAEAGAAGAGMSGASKAGKLARFGKGLGKALGPIGLALGAYDIYTTYKDNQSRSSAAQEYLDSSVNTFEDYNANPDDYEDNSRRVADAYATQADIENGNNGRMGGSVGSLAGGMAGMAAGGKLGAVAGAGIGALFGGVGAAPGAAIGGAIGAVGGGIAGALGGGALGETIGENFSAIQEKVSSVWSSIVDGTSVAWQEISQTVSDSIDSIETFFDPLKEGAFDVINFIVGLGAILYESIEPSIESIVDAVSSTWDEIKEGASALWDDVIEIWNSAIEYLGELFQPILDISFAVWDGISLAASAAWSVISSAADACWNELSSIWGIASAWFDSTVWSPIASAVDTATSAITGAFDGALTAIKGAWAGLAGWFESTIYKPIADKVNSIIEKGRSITHLGGGSNDSEKASGGFVYGRQHVVVGEAGMEAIIPLSGSRRARGMDLWQKAGAMLGIGVGSYQPDGNLNLGDEADYGGGNDDTGDTSGITFTAPAGGTSDGGVSISIGSLAPTFTITGGEGADPESIMAIVRSQCRSMADDIAAEIADKVAGINGNQPLRA